MRRGDPGLGKLAGCTALRIGVILTIQPTTSNRPSQKNPHTNVTFCVKIKITDKMAVPPAGTHK